MHRLTDLLVGGYGHVLAFESHPFGPDLRELLEEPLPVPTHFENLEFWGLALGLLYVAKVGGQDGLRAADEQVSGGAGEPRQVPPVLRCGDKDGIQPLLFKDGAQVVQP